MLGDMRGRWVLILFCASLSLLMFSVGCDLLGNGDAAESEEAPADETQEEDPVDDADEDEDAGDPEADDQDEISDDRWPEQWVGFRGILHLIETFSSYSYWAYGAIGGGYTVEY